MLTDDTAPGGEVLPQNWNRDQTGYVIRYIKGDPGPGRRKLVVKVVPMGTNMLLCTFLESPGEKTAELTLTPEFLTADYRDCSKYVSSCKLLNGFFLSFLQTTQWLFFFLSCKQLN